MNLWEERYNFLLTFFKYYRDYNIDLKMRLIPLAYSDKNFEIEWTDFSKNKILLLVEYNVNQNEVYTLNGLISYLFKEINYSSDKYLHLQLDFYNAAKEMEILIKFFESYFSINFNQQELRQLLENNTYKKRMNS